MLPAILPYAWTLFEFGWTAERREYALMTQATDATGNTQTIHHPFNREGYLFNMVHLHKVTAEKGRVQSASRGVTLSLGLLTRLAESWPPADRPS